MAWRPTQSDARGSGGAVARSHAAAAPLEAAPRRGQRATRGQRLSRAGESNARRGCRKAGHGRRSTAASAPAEGVRRPRASSRSASLRLRRPQGARPERERLRASALGPTARTHSLYAWRSPYRNSRAPSPAPAGDRTPAPSPRSKRDLCAHGETHRPAWPATPRRTGAHSPVCIESSRRAAYPFQRSRQLRAQNASKTSVILAAHRAARWSSAPETGAALDDARAVA